VFGRRTRPGMTARCRGRAFFAGGQCGAIVSLEKGMDGPNRDEGPYCHYYLALRRERDSGAETGGVEGSDGGVERL
jgi:hypothetical protein